MWSSFKSWALGANEPQAQQAQAQAPAPVTVAYSNPQTPPAADPQILTPAQQEAKFQQLLAQTKADLAKQQERTEKAAEVAAKQAEEDKVALAAEAAQKARDCIAVNTDTGVMTIGDAGLERVTITSKSGLCIGGTCINEEQLGKLVKSTFSAVIPPPVTANTAVQPVFTTPVTQPAIGGVNYFGTPV